MGGGGREVVLKALMPTGFMLLKREARNKPSRQAETTSKHACLKLGTKQEWKKICPEYTFIYQAHTRAGLKAEEGLPL